MKKIALLIMSVFMFSSSAFALQQNKAPSLDQMKKNIQVRADKHIQNIQSFKSCVNNAKKFEDIKVCKDTMEKNNIAIKNASGMN